MQLINRNSHRYRKIRYRWSGPKFCKNLIILIVIISIGTLWLTTAAKATFDERKGQIFNVTVLHGDTLWSIAKRIAPGADPRRVIAHIKLQNHLRDSALIAGQELSFELDR
jgi:hypothetical protein